MRAHMRGASEQVTVRNWHLRHKPRPLPCQQQQLAAGEPEAFREGDRAHVQVLKRRAFAGQPESLPPVGAPACAALADAAPRRCSSDEDAAYIGASAWGLGCSSSLDTVAAAVAAVAAVAVASHCRVSGARHAHTADAAATPSAPPSLPPLPPELPQVRLAEERKAAAEGSTAENEASETRVPGDTRRVP